MAIQAVDDQVGHVTSVLIPGTETTDLRLYQQTYSLEVKEYTASGKTVSHSKWGIFTLSLFSEADKALFNRTRGLLLVWILPNDKDS